MTGTWILSTLLSISHPEDFFNGTDAFGYRVFQARSIDSSFWLLRREAHRLIRSDKCSSELIFAELDEWPSMINAQQKCA